MSILEELNQEIDRRIEIMESPDYDMGPPLSRVDYIAIFVIAVLVIIMMVVAY